MYLHVQYMYMYLISGIRLMISFNCSLNPISNNLSASSNTTYSIDDNFKSISIRMCKNLPGVAITLCDNNNNLYR